MASNISLSSSQRDACSTTVTLYSGEKDKSGTFRVKAIIESPADLPKHLRSYGKTAFAVQLPEARKGNVGTRLKAVYLGIDLAAIVETFMGIETEAPAAPEANGVHA